MLKKKTAKYCLGNIFFPLNFAFCIYILKSTNINVCFKLRNFCMFPVS